MMSYVGYICVQTSGQLSLDIHALRPLRVAVHRVRGGREVVAVAGEVRDAPLVAVDAVDEGRGRGGGGIAGVRAGVRMRRQERTRPPSINHRYLVTAAGNGAASSDPDLKT